MIFPKMVLAKRELRKRLKTLTKTGGSQYETKFMPMNDNFSPEAPVELNLSSIGFEDAGLSPIGHDRRDVLYQITIKVARRLANDENEIDDIALAVAADVERVLMQDVHQGDIVHNTEIRGGNVVDDQGSSHYAWSLVVALNIQTLEKNPLQQPST